MYAIRSYYAFVVEAAELSRILPGFQNAGAGGAAPPEALLTGSSRWKRVVGENVYCLVPGTDSKLADDLLIVEAFYDGEALTPGAAPGAEEAVSAAALLDLARQLSYNFV